MPDKFPQSTPKKFSQLSDQEILAVAISSEADDARIYADIAKRLHADYPSTAEMFTEMQKEELEHQQRLTKIYQKRFGEHIPLLRRTDVKGFVSRKPVWLVSRLGINRVRKLAESMELETRHFYERAAAKTDDPDTRQLLLDLAEAEKKHSEHAESLKEKILTPTAKQTEDEAQRRLFVLQVVQPGLAGLMDGSVSTLAPLFAAAFATHNSLDAFRVGLAASLGAGISMGFAEALSDDGSLTGRGKPLLRGFVCGLMTTAGGIGHTLPYLIHDFRLATIVAACVVAVELLVISYIRNHYMDTPFLSAAFQVIVGGILVFLTGIFIGSA
jgi:rubrerythrin